nr:predicted GPI-anchored protein 58 [Odocoileus virginianus texanus]
MLVPSQRTKIPQPPEDLQGKVRIRGQQAGTERTTSPRSFQTGTRPGKAAGGSLTHGHRHSGDKNLTPPLPSLKPEQTTQKARPPGGRDPPDCQNRGRPPPPAPGNPAPSSPDPVSPQPGRAIRAQRTPRPPASAASRAPRRPTPHTPPAPEARPDRERAPSAPGRAKLLTGRARLPRLSRASAPLPRPRFPGKKQTLVKTSLLNRPCCLPAGERQGRATQADTHPGQLAAAQGGEGAGQRAAPPIREREGRAGPGPSLRVRVSPLSPPAARPPSPTPPSRPLRCPP